jgi:ASCH domain
MKCISLNQPYAEMLAIGKKLIECRKWYTKFRGDFLIHASKTIDVKACEYYKVNSNDVVRGSIIGKAKLYDVKKYLNYKEFFVDKDKHFSLNPYDNKIIYGFLIKEAIKFTWDIPYKGKLGFFEVNEFK